MGFEQCVLALCISFFPSLFQCVACRAPSGPWAGPGVPTERAAAAALRGACAPCFTAAVASRLIACFPPSSPGPPPGQLHRQYVPHPAQHGPGQRHLRGCAPCLHSFLPWAAVCDCAPPLQIGSALCGSVAVFSRCMRRPARGHPAPPSAAHPSPARTPLAPQAPLSAATWCPPRLATSSAAPLSWAPPMLCRLAPLAMRVRGACRLGAWCRAAQMRGMLPSRLRLARCVLLQHRLGAHTPPGWRHPPHAPCPTHRTAPLSPPATCRSV